MPEFNRRKLLSAALLCAAGVTASLPAQAAEATLMSSALMLDVPGERPGLFVTSSFEFDLPEALSEALHRGIALYFVHEFRLSKERWYWFDKVRLEARFLIRISFDPLTQRYRLSYNGLSHSFDSLEEVLPYVKTIRRWRVGPSNAILSQENVAELRFYLDTSKLPKPMQVANTGSSDWTVSSDWTEITIPSDVVVS